MAQIARRRRADDSPLTTIQHAAKHTAALVRMHRSIGSAKPTAKVIPSQIYPHMIEQEYGAALAGVVRFAAAALQPLKDQLPALLESARAARRRDSAAELALQRREVAGLPIVI